MKAGPRLVCVAALIAVGAQMSPLAAETPVPIELRSSHGRWLVRVATDQPSVVYLGIDTEGTGRETHNLLREPLRLSSVPISWRRPSCCGRDRPGSIRRGSIRISRTGS